MNSTQKRLWPDAQPLVERLGREFFRQLPETPGVYLMTGEGETVLYVGKAKNLRHRLGSYRVANPERMAKRTLRLLNLVERIGWEECESESAAVRREAELLMSLKPRFNRAGVWEGPKRFLVWRAVPEGMELGVVDAAGEGWSCAGPFGAHVIHIHRALVRLLWCRFYPEAGLAGMPSGWFHGQHGTRVLLPHSDGALTSRACEILALAVCGGFDPLQEWLLPVTAVFEQPVRDDDWEFVTKHWSGSSVRFA